MNNRYISRILVLVGLVVVVIIILPYFMPVQLPNVAMSAFGSETARARVTQIIEEGNIDLGTTTQRYQIARVELLEGEYRGISMEMDYGKRQVLSGEIYLQPGDTILVTVGKRPDGVLTVYFVDFVRLIPIFWLAGIFAISIILISGWKGISFHCWHGL